MFLHFVVMQKTGHQMERSAKETDECSGRIHLLSYELFMQLNRSSTLDKEEIWTFIKTHLTSCDRLTVTFSCIVLMHIDWLWHQHGVTEASQQKASHCFLVVFFVFQLWSVSTNCHGAFIRPFFVVSYCPLLNAAPWQAAKISKYDWEKTWLLSRTQQRLSDG